MPRGLIPAVLTAALLLAPVGAACAQDMIDQLDLKSDEFTKADVTREDVLAAIAAAAPDGVADFSGKRLNGLDLSGLDLRRLKLQATRPEPGHASSCFSPPPRKMRRPEMLSIGDIGFASIADAIGWNHTARRANWRGPIVLCVMQVRA